MLRSILESENIDLGDQETTNYTTTTGPCEGSEVRKSTSSRIISLVTDEELEKRKSNSGENQS
jgi:hypothetical protein